jgi:adenylosuccinate lyase
MEQDQREKQLFQQTSYLISVVEAQKQQLRELRDQNERLVNENAENEGMVFEQKTVIAKCTDQIGHFEALNLLRDQILQALEHETAFFREQNETLKRKLKEYRSDREAHKLRRKLKK